MFRDAIERSVKRRADKSMADKVVVAVKAEKVISRTALAWALNHVAHPGDCITLLAVFSAEKSGNTSASFGFCGNCVFVSCLLWICETRREMWILREAILELSDFGRRLRKQPEREDAGSDIRDLRVVFADGPSISQSNRGEKYEITETPLRAFPFRGPLWSIRCSFSLVLGHVICLLA